MNTAEAVALIASAVGGHGRGGTWADIGAGEGTFTRALADVLGAGSTIYALDRDAGALAALARTPARADVRVVPVIADFAGDLALPGGPEAGLDGILLANALHFAEDAGAVLAKLATLLAPGGRVVLVEYDRRGGSRWVPFPIPVAQLPHLSSAAGLSTFEVTATRPSAYAGNLYAAWAERWP